MLKNRNIFVQILLLIVTVGIYGIYWFYVSYSEMNEYKQLGEKPLLWTVVALIPLLNFIALYKHAEAVEALTEGNISRVLMFIVWVTFAPGAWLITQLEMNKRATP